jgi:hypothetical protein
MTYTSYIVKLKTLAYLTNIFNNINYLRYICIHIPCHINKAYLVR